MNPNPSKRSLYSLGFALATHISGQILMFAIASLAAMNLGASTSQGTLPLFAAQASGLWATLPLSLLMNRLGRKPVFLFTASCALVGVSISLFALQTGNLYLFIFSFIFFGIHQSAGFYYRFAALEIAPPGQEKRALGLVFSGGVIASILGPFLARQAQGFSEHAFAGGFYALSSLLVIQIVLVGLTQFPQARRLPIHLEGIIQLALRPELAKPMVLGALSFGIMSFVMLATPMAMKAKGFDFSLITFVIQWHMLGMYLPSMITGRLMQQKGERYVALLGGVTMLVCLGAGLSGDGDWNFIISLGLLGLGWNLAYLAATSLLAKSLAPEDAAMGQGLNEILVLSVNSFTSLSSGAALALLGWNGLLYATLPFAVIMLALYAWPSLKKAQI